MTLPYRSSYRLCAVASNLRSPTHLESCDDEYQRTPAPDDPPRRLGESRMPLRTPRSKSRPGECCSFHGPHVISAKIVVRTPPKPATKHARLARFDDR